METKRLNLRKMIALAICLAVLCMSCGKSGLRGTYVLKNEGYGYDSIEFKGKTIKMYIFTDITKGTYKTEDDKIIITVKERGVMTIPYKISGKTIIFDGIEYEKK
jgi:major membrane immunogen (membrane-anchored lipoprotein)